MTDEDLENYIKYQLLAYWDPDSPLDMSALEKAYGDGKTLDEVGILPNEAMAYVNKYNSLIFSNSGKGPLVKGSQAAAWVAEKMSSIVAIIAARAKP